MPFFCPGRPVGGVPGDSARLLCAHLHQHDGRVAPGRQHGTYPYLLIVFVLSSFSDKCKCFFAMPVAILNTHTM
jgi:hypothetical protein